MTYCVGLLLNEGMVLLSDTRTNAGLDNIATYRKMFIFEEPGERVIVDLTAGSLSVTQTTIARLREAIDDPEATEATSIMQAPTMLKVAEIVGNTLATVRIEIDEKLASMRQGASATMIVAGQRRGGAMRLFLIYPEGNFIEATEDTPFLQIGEHKYGKPILDRVVKPSTSWTMRKRRCCCRWIRRCGRTCRSGCRWTWRDRERRLPGRPQAPDRGGRPEFPRDVRGLVDGAARRLRADHALRGLGACSAALRDAGRTAIERQRCAEQSAALSRTARGVAVFHHDLVLGARIARPACRSASLPSGRWTGLDVHDLFGRAKRVRHRQIAARACARSARILVSAAFSQPRLGPPSASSGCACDLALHVVPHLGIGGQHIALERRLST